MFKDMSDEALQAEITTLQNLTYLMSQTKTLRLGKYLREMDIAIAVTRGRIRRGEWTLAR